MNWQFSDDVQAYSDRVWPLLTAQPVHNTLALTVLSSLLAGRRWSSAPPTLGWYESSSAVTGAVLMTPPYELILAKVPADAFDDLVASLRAQGVTLPGVNGEMSCSHTFARAWTAATGVDMLVTIEERLYQLATLQPVQPAPAGQARIAQPDDGLLAVEWFDAFHAEAGLPAVDVAPMVLERISAGLVWLWVDAAGEVVSLAGRNPTAARTARIGPVYTPPENRRQGFAAAVTAACSSDALARDADNVVLFTDLANPTSNSIYQQIGFRPVQDHHLIHFSQR